MKVVVGEEALSSEDLVCQKRNDLCSDLPSCTTNLMCFCCTALY
jgi:hypothetical protein